MQEYTVQVKMSGQPGSGWTRITDRFLAPATAAVVQAYRQDGLREIEEYNGFTIMISLSAPHCQGGEVLIAIPRTELAIRSSGPDAGDFRAAVVGLDDRPIMEAMLSMRKRIDLALIAQLQKDTGTAEPTGYTRELPMYRGFALYVYEGQGQNHNRATLVIHARTAVAQLYSTKPDGESALKESAIAALTSWDGWLADVEASAKRNIDRAYADPRWSMAALADLSLEIPPKGDTAT